MPQVCEINLSPKRALPRILHTPKAAQHFATDDSLAPERPKREVQTQFPNGFKERLCRRAKVDFSRSGSQILFMPKIKIAGSSRFYLNVGREFPNLVEPTTMAQPVFS